MTLYLAYLIKHEDSDEGLTEAHMFCEQLCRTRSQANRHIAFELIEIAMVCINKYDMNMPKCCKQYLRYDMNGYEIKKEYTYDTDVAMLLKKHFCVGETADYIVSNHIVEIEVD